MRSLGSKMESATKDDLGDVDADEKPCRHRRRHGFPLACGLHQQPLSSIEFSNEFGATICSQT